MLRAAELVAAEQHRRALGDEQRGQEVALLARAQGEDLGVVGVAFDAAVPGAVVVGAVPVALEVGLVVLAVVGHQVGSVKPSWAVMKLIEANGSRPSSS